MIGRKEEISTLVDCINSKRPEFIAIYGRRRVGKTYLVKEFFRDNFSFYATGVQNKKTGQQLRIFKESLVKYGDKIKTIPKDWFEAFSRLEKLLESDQVPREYETGRRVVFLDELPWMDTPRSDFKSALDYFWNSWGSSQKDLVLVVCGSATSWIINNIVKDTGGFYNRLTRQIRLLPFNLGECEQLLESNGLQLTKRQVVECSMIFGGIPYYLNYLKPQLSLAQNVQMLFFQENAPLKYEFHNLFYALFRNADNYISIVLELSKRRYGYTRAELINTGKVKDGKTLTKSLDDLVQCGFVRKYHDFSKKVNGCHYQLVDALCLFHLSFLTDGKTGSWLEFINTPAYYTWCGLAFEIICLLHTKQIKQALGISGIYSQEFSWNSKKTKPGAQIDLLIDRKDDVINVCEMKYSREPYSIDEKYEADLLRKMEVFRSETKTKKALMLTFISFSGMKKNAYSNNILCEIGADDLFRLY